MKILVVCVGNICRSPLAERLLRSRLQAAAQQGEQGTESYDVSSAGLRAIDGHAMDPLAAAELTRLGGDPEGFGSQLATAHVIERADLVLTMTKDLRTDVLRRSPRMMRRTFTMAEFAAVCTLVPDLADAPDVIATAARSRAHAAGAADVPDPIGQSQKVHAHVADLISGFVDDQVAVLRQV